MAPRTRSPVARPLLGALALCLAARMWLAPAAFASSPQTRRAALGAAASAALFGACAGDAGAVYKCPKDVNNCLSTLNEDKNQVAPWRWPEGQSRDDAVSSFRQVLEAYPLAGQGGIDAGGWDIAVDGLDRGWAPYARVEYFSGKGTLSTLLNFGARFVDDLEVSFGKEYVIVKSSSRVGDGGGLVKDDFGVNAKRLNYIASGLRAKGWDAPSVNMSRFEASAKSTLFVNMSKSFEKTYVANATKSGAKTSVINIVKSE